MDEIYDFGKILQKLRKEKGLTQEQLARRINKESSIISRYEKGLQNPTFETVKEFAAIFNVSMDYLAGMEKNSNISTFGMSSEQVEIVKNLVEAFRKKNISMSRKTDAENYQIIGRIAVELSNSKLTVI
ncbi:MAG: helix-turn-helix transcriptional regulator [Eubacteriales bacterium]|nr:helix-turn-helix transcriptional regulator [Eubacteriales bacterium]